MVYTLCRAGKTIPTIVLMHIGQIIRALRQEREWSQERLAHEADLDTSEVSRFERGLRRLPTTKLEAIAKALGTTPANLYAVAEGREPPPAPCLDEGDTTIDYSLEAVQLRRLVRDLDLEERRLLLDFGKLLLNRRKQRDVA